MSNKKRQVVTKGSVHRKGNNHWCMCHEGRQRTMLDVYQVGKMKDTDTWRTAAKTQLQADPEARKWKEHTGCGGSQREILSLS